MAFSGLSFLLAECHSENFHSAECHSQDSHFDYCHFVECNSKDYHLLTVILRVIILECFSADCHST